MPFSIGSLYIVKTWDRDGARDRRHGRDTAAVSGEMPARNVIAFPRAAESPVR